MINIDRSFYGIHTMEEIYKMFEKNEDVLQINIFNFVESSSITPKYDMIAHFSGSYQTHSRTFSFREITSVNKCLCDKFFKDTDKFVITSINVSKNLFEDCFDIQICVKTLSDEVKTTQIDYAMEVSKDDYLSIDEIRERYCWRDDVECVMIQSTGILGMLLNESKDKTSESRNYNDKLVKLFKDKSEFVVANFKNKYFDGCIITFVPLNPSQTKFNVHITGYFTDMKGLYELKNESNKED